MTLQDASNSQLRDGRDEHLSRLEELANKHSNPTLCTRIAAEVLEKLLLAEDTQMTGKVQVHIQGGVPRFVTIKGG